MATNEPSEPYLVIAITVSPIIPPIIEASGTIISIDPAAVSTPLPPWNLKKMDQL